MTHMTVIGRCQDVDCLADNQPLIRVAVANGIYLSVCEICRKKRVRAWNARRPLFINKLRTI